jgi:DNA-binding MarR family transcriptional regulator
MKPVTPRKSPTTPFPSALLDQVMPTLKDTEWRLLCVIVRQTLGWRDAATGGRKKWDWLTQRQLIRRTGRSSEAISRAINSLVRHGIIEAQSRTGRPLVTPIERRQARGHIRYALCSQFLDCQRRFEVLTSEYPESNDSSGNSPLRSQNRKSEFGGAVKPNGTKETTKQNITKRLTQRDHDALESFLDLYSRQYESSGHGVLPEPSNQTIESLSALLMNCSPTVLTRLSQAFFMCQMPVIVRNGYALDAFMDCIHLLQFMPPRS